VPHRDDLKAAIARAEEAERRLSDTQKLRAVKKDPTNDGQLVEMHLDNIAEPPNGIFFMKITGFGNCTVLTDDDDPNRALAYKINRWSVEVICIGNDQDHKVWNGEVWFWKKAWKIGGREHTRQKFKGKHGKRLKLALQALHIRTRAKGPV